MIKTKPGILEKLKEAGYSTYRIRKERLIGEATMQQIRNGEAVSVEIINILCRLLECQPGDLLEYVYVAGEEEKESRRKKKKQSFEIDSMNAHKKQEEETGEDGENTNKSDE